MSSLSSNPNIDMVRSSASSLQVSLLSVSITLQLLIIMGCINFYLTKKINYNNFLFPSLVLCLSLTSISFSMKSNMKIKANNNIGRQDSYTTLEKIFYIINIVIFSLLVSSHHFINNDLIHKIRLFLILITISLSFSLIFIHGDDIKL